MKKILIFLLMLLMYAPVLIAQNSVTGFVYDGQTNNPLPGASIYIPDIKTGTATDGNGFFFLRNLPQTKLLIQVKYLGFTTNTQIIDIRTSDTVRFFLQPTSIEGKEVVITGTAITSESERNSVAVRTVDRIDVITVPTNNLIDALAHTPGVSQITTGSAISKPVIRGLSFNRIITLHDGVRQEGQQWGDEHGIEIDKYAADRIEVMRGPASLMYGSDALGGVINILEPVTPQINSLKGNLATQFFTNEKLTGNSLMLEGNSNGLFARVRGSFTDAAAYHTPEEKIDNSGYQETNLSSTIGLNKKWGFSHVVASRYNSYIGLPVDLHIHGEEEHEHEEEEHEDHGHDHLHGRDIDVPYQQVTHNKVILNNRFYTGNSQLTIKGGWQQNQRREFEDEIDEPALFLDLHSWTGDIKYFFPEKNNWQRVIGVSGMHQVNKIDGEEFLIPAYSINEGGIFFFLKKINPRTAWNAGIRFDMREVVSEGLIVTDSIADTIFNTFKRNFSATTGAVGMTLRFNDLFYMKANLGSGFRAPNISELSSNGLHSGTFRFEVGNSDLKPEQSYQFDLSFLAESKRVDGELNLFTNYITNYIYPALVNETTQQGDELLPVYRYTQGNAILTGFEFSLDAHILHHLHFENAISFVYGHNRLTDSPLPLMPPMSIHNELRYDFHFLETKTIKEPYIKFSVDNHLPQKRVDEFESETSGYSLINAGVGTGLKIKNQEWVIAISANNIADIKYFDHLNRLKNFGILNKGRNISFSVFIPFTLYSKS